MTTIRCSSLNIAAWCPGAPALLARTETGTDETRTGTVVHSWIERYLNLSRGEATEWLLGKERSDLFDELADFADWFEATILPTLDVDLLQTECGRCKVLGDDLVLSGHTDVSGTVGSDGKRRVVIDWKHGYGQRWILPPIRDDYQMLGYALLLDEEGVESVRVLRVLVSDLEYEEMTLDRGQLDVARDLVTAIARNVAARPDTRTPGPHCDHCLARESCPERAGQVDAVRNALVPYAGRDVVLTTDQARRWALARGAIRDRCDAMDAALRAQLAAGLVVESTGQRLALVGSGSRDKIVDANAAIDALTEIVGDAARGAVSTSKGAIERVLKARKVPAAPFFDELRADGAMVSEPMEKSIRWVKA